MDGIREPAVSGTFYPGNKEVLRIDVDGYLSKVPLQEPQGAIIGLISPHAGYMYSGQTAAYGYKAISGTSFDTVIIVAPSHQSFFLGTAVQEKGGYRTPMGVVPIDEELASALIGKGDVVRADPRVHRSEHSIEVQLPFLQTVLKDFKIVPLIMGTSQDPEASRELADAVHMCIKAKRKRYLILGSTDLSHYYPYDLAKELDKAAMDLLEGFDVEGMIRELARGKYEACGAGPIISTMIMSRMLGASRAKVLNYMNSGDVTGDLASVVGYVSCIFCGE
jgi:AmmeMemoRadiSam system protein B